MEQMRLFDLEIVPLAMPKYKGHPGKMCSECKDIFSVDHPYGERKFYCRKQISKNLVGHGQIRKYSSACFMFKQGSGNITNYYRSGFNSLSMKKIGVPRLVPRRYKAAT